MHRIKTIDSANGKEGGVPNKDSATTMTLQPKISYVTQPKQMTREPLDCRSPSGINHGLVVFVDSRHHRQRRTQGPTTLGTGPGSEAAVTESQDATR